MIRRFVLFAAVFLFALPYAHADEASKRVKIEEMFTVLKMDSMMKQMMNQGLAQGKEVAKSMMGGAPMTAADQKIMDDYMAKVFAVVSDRLSWEKLEPAYIDLYASAYTEEEVDGILAFYKSPVGQALLAKTPELITKSGAIVNGRMQELGPRMQEVMADLQKQLQAAHPDKAPPK
jgi:hypothetical protein